MRIKKVMAVRHMPNLSKRLISIFLTLVLAFIMTGAPVSARTLDEINRDIENTQRTRDDLARQGKDVTDQLADVEKSIATIQGDISTLEDQLKLVQDAKTAAEAALLQLQAKLQSTENDLAEQSDVIDTRLSSIYKSGDLGYVEVILGAKSFDDLINRMNYLTMIVKSDKQVFDRINELKDEIEKDRDAADAKKQEILSREGAILKIKQPLDYRKAELDQEKGVKQSLFERLRTDQNALARAADALEAEHSAAVERARNSGGGGPVSPGGYIWPCYGAINSPYGWRIHPILGGWRFHYGIDIDAYEWTEVASVKAGVVEVVSWSEAVGLAVEVNHGGGVYSRYLHLNQALVSEGQSVAQGQIIALSGNTGYLTNGAHLHFELYDFNNPSNYDGTVNPLDYLP